MPVWEGLNGLMSVTAAGSKGIATIVCVAGSSDSDMPSTMGPVSGPPVDGVSSDPFVDGVSSDVGAVGEEAPQPATLLTSSIAAIPTTPLRRFSIHRA
jgi:hypothetical protein